MTMQLVAPVHAIQDACYSDIRTLNLRVWEDLQAPWYEAEFEAAEIAYDAQQEELAIYHGYTEAEYENLPDWRFRNPEPAPSSYDDMIMEFDGHRIYIHCDCDVCRDVCLCGCRDEPEQHSISLEATARPFWRFKAWWSRLTHR